MEEILQKIARADEAQASELLEAVLRRYAELYPDWDVGTISVQKSKDPKKQLDDTIRVLESMKEGLQRQAGR